MTALTKFVLALEATLGGIEATVLAATGDPARSDAQTAIAVALGCAAGTLGIAYAAGAAFNAGRGPEQDAPLAPASLGPLAQKTGAEWNADGTWNERFVWDGTFTPEAEAEIREGARQRDAAVFAAYDTMRQRPATEAPEPYRGDETPPESAAETTRIDPLPEALTHEMPSQEPWKVPVAPAAPRSPTSLEFMAAAPQEPPRPRHAAQPGSVDDSWFRRPAERSGRAA